MESTLGLSSLLTARGEEVLPCISYIGNVPPHRVGFLCRFGLKTGMHFAHFGLESSMVLRELWECMNVFILSIPKWIQRIFLFALKSMTTQFLPKGQFLKRVWKIIFFGLK